MTITFLCSSEQIWQEFAECSWVNYFSFLFSCGRQNK